MANGNKINEMVRGIKFFLTDALIRGVMFRIR